MADRGSYLRRDSGISKMKIISRSEHQTISFGRHLARHLDKGSIVCLVGGLGSGKTVLTKGIAEGLGISAKKVISPTFVLLRQHQGRVPLNHFDLYRMDTLRDISDLGYEEFFYADAVTVVEWADRLKGMFPRTCLKIEIAIHSKNRRRILLTACGDRYAKIIRDFHEDTRC